MKLGIVYYTAEYKVLVAISFTCEDDSHPTKVGIHPWSSYINRELLERVSLLFVFATRPFLYCYYEYFS